MEHIQSSTWYQRCCRSKICDIFWICQVGCYLIFFFLILPSSDRSCSTGLWRFDLFLQLSGKYYYNGVSPKSKEILDLFVELKTHLGLILAMLSRHWERNTFSGNSSHNNNPSELPTVDKRFIFFTICRSISTVTVRGREKQQCYTATALSQGCHAVSVLVVEHVSPGQEEQPMFWFKDKFVNKECLKVNTKMRWCLVVTSTINE